MAPAFAAALAAPGDTGLRHDIQLLADYGVISGPVTSWPLSWDSIAAELAAVDDTKTQPAAIEASLQRLRARVERNTRRDDWKFDGAHVAAAENPVPIRSFENTPRESVEVSAGFSWVSDRLSVNLRGTAVDSPADDQSVRADGSQIGISLYNYTIAASTMERWWGPGWDGSLILSNNARPVPALTISRNLTKPFKSKWLSWIGPWDMKLIWGQMEEDRVVPNTRLFGFRFNFRPIPSLEIGLARTAQWCGEDRPCDSYTFTDLLLGRDNVGDAGVTADSEAGNQLAGLDFRWSNHWFGTPMAVYGQFTGEDEAGGFPSRYLAQVGSEFSGRIVRLQWSYRVFAEFAATSCDVLKDEILNCAYNHPVYETGYRYRGRAVGHGADNDALFGTIGLIVLTEKSHEFRASLRGGGLNHAGAVDPRHSLTPSALDLLSIDLSYSRPIGKGRIDLSLGFEHLEDPSSANTFDEARAVLQWRSGF